MTSNPERDLHTYLAADVAHSDRDGSERGYGGAAYLAARREQRRIDSEPCPKCGGDKLRPDTTLGWSCHARSSAPAGLPLHEPTDRDASDVLSDRVRAYAEAFRARKGPRCAECVELGDWSDCAECDAVVAVEVADREQAELRAENERWRGRADRRLAEAKKAEAEVEQLTHLLGSHADGHRCTCTMIDPGNFHVEGGNAHPPEWEQDPWCPTHPDVDQIKGDLRNLSEDWANTADYNEDTHPREANAFRKAAAELRAALGGHVCSECPDCIHDGQKCAAAATTARAAKPPAGPPLHEAPLATPYICRHGKTSAEHACDDHADLLRGPEPTDAP